MHSEISSDHQLVVDRDPNSEKWAIRSRIKFEDQKGWKPSPIETPFIDSFKINTGCKSLGINVPTVVKYFHNILLMEFIGNDENAPKLKDAYPKNPEKFFKDLVKQIKTLYDGKMFHGDLSAFNILNHKEVPVFIDFSHDAFKAHFN